MGVLDKIVATKKKEHDDFQKRISESIGIETYRKQVHSQLQPANRLLSALKQSKIAPFNLAVIAECKKASPSAGLLRPDYDALSIAQTYRSLGAAACSVLTDVEYFQGSLDDARAVAQSGIATLRKDFILFEDQIYEAAEIGAAAVLLIVRLLDDTTLRRLLQTATSLHLDTLVETHCTDEVSRAVDAGAHIIGINHRNLDTLTIDLSLSEKAALMIRRQNPDAIIVAESGIEHPDFLRNLKGSADAVLIGSYFMRSANIATAWAKLLAESN